MAEITHIVPVGHTSEKLIQGIRRFPVSKVILLLGDNPNLSGEPEAVKTSEEIVEALTGFAEVEKIEVSKEDVYTAALKIIDIVKKENTAGKKVMINVSGSMRTLGIACYIAACLTKTEIYATLSKYEKGTVIGVEKTYSLPLFSFKELPKERMEILTALNKGEAASVEELIKRMKPSLDEASKEYKSERSRLSYHLKSLREEGLIETEKEGKNIRLRISQKGRITSEKDM